MSQAKTAREIPNKLFYKIGEVCQITDTQPYVLRFWESEFPQLAPKKNRSGQRVYQRRDIDTVLRIKSLLYEEEYTIAGARRKLDEDAPGGRGAPEPADSAPPQAGVTPVLRRPRPVSVDHPVDDLPGRSARPQAATPEREARLERALAEVKASLRDLLESLRDS